MIGWLRGELVDLDGNLATVLAGGVGYEVAVPDSVLMQMPKLGEIVELRTRQIFREDGVSLYGFLEGFQRRLFDLLLEVKGCGPKVALALLGQVGEEAVATAILSQDARTLSKASGVGPRLAERIILELKDKIQEVALQRKISAATAATGRTHAAGPPDEVVEALLALGYRRAEAEAAADAAREEADSVEDQILAALRRFRR